MAIRDGSRGSGGNDRSHGTTDVAIHPRRFYSPTQGLFTHIGEERHEACSFDGRRDRMLAGCRASAFPTSDDSSLSVDHLFQKFDVLVIDIHRTRSLTVDENRVFLTGAGTDSRSLSCATPSAHGTGRHIDLGGIGEWSARPILGFSYRLAGNSIGENWPVLRAGISRV